MKKALFLDRDGVINVDHGYLYQASDIEFMPGIFDLCRHCHNLGYLIIVVTNQSGIGRGYYTEADFLILCEWMKLRFIEKGSLLERIYYCPHHAESAADQYRRQCDCRKPMPGMLLQAAKAYQLDMANSIMIGDKLSDIIAAHRAGVKRRYLLTSQTNHLTPELDYDYIQAASLLEIKQQITE